MEQKSLNQKLFEIQKLHLKFPKTAQAYKYKYVPLEELWEKLVPELDKRRLLVRHKTEHGSHVTTQVIDTETGDFTESSIKLPENPDPQKLGSAITYYRRYNLNQLFNLMSEEDNDGAYKPDKLKANQSEDPDLDF